MLPWRTSFHSYNDRYCNLCNTYIQVPRILRSYFAYYAHSPMPSWFKAGLNFINKSLTSPKWNHLIYRGKMPNLQTATHQSLHLGRHYTPLCPLWRTIRQRLARNHFQHCCWHITRYIVHRSLYLWKLPLWTKRSTLVLPFGSSFGFIQDL